MAKAEKTGGGSLDELYRRPGFLLRRAHQISVALFLEEAAGLGMTTSQYGTLVALRARANLGQAEVARLVGIDRSTTALVVGKLEEAGYVERREDPVDNRRKIITLSPAGHAVLARMAGPAQRARKRALDSFSAGDAAEFLSLLEHFVQTFNEDTRAPIRDVATKHSARCRCPDRRVAAIDFGVNHSPAPNELSPRTAQPRLP